MNKWDEFNKATEGKGPRTLLVEAVSLPRGKALDLGAGALNDSKFLADLGHDVTAVDSNPAVAKYVEEGVEVVISKYEDFFFPWEEYVIVNAQFALPFCDPAKFSKVFNDLKDSIERGGVFTGNFFGPNDEWSHNKKMTFLTKAEVEDLFSGFSILKIEEKDYVGPTTGKVDKRWHIIDVIARKL